MSNKSMSDQIFDASNLSAREQVTSWIKIKDKLGTRVAGKFMGFWEKPAEGKFRRQVSIALQDFDDPKIVYGVTLPDYFEKDLCHYKVGDKCGAEYYKDIPAKEAGMSDTKAVRLFNLDRKARQEAGNDTAEVPSAPAASPTGTTTNAPAGTDEDDPF